MPLVTCPDCERRVSDAAPMCVHCGRPMANRPLVATQGRPPALSSDRRVDTALNCPRCGSDETRQVSLVYAEGTSTTSGSVHTYGGSSDGGSGYRFGNYSGSQQTELSRRLAPPEEKKHTPLSVTVLFVALGVVAFFVLSAGGTPAGVFYIGLPIAFLAFYAANGEAREWNATELPKLRAEWERQFLCRRCGAVFKP